MSTEEERIRAYSEMLHAECGPVMQQSFIHGMLYSIVERMMTAKFPKQMTAIKGQLYKAMGGSELVGVAAERFKQGMMTGDKG